MALNDDGMDVPGPALGVPRDCFFDFKREGFTDFLAFGIGLAIRVSKRLVVVCPGGEVAAWVPLGFDRS